MFMLKIELIHFILTAFIAKILHVENYTFWKCIRTRVGWACNGRFHGELRPLAYVFFCLRTYFASLNI